LELAARETEWSQRYGRDHLAVVGLRNNMQGIRASILDELRRLREACRSDYEIASTTEKLIEGQLQGAIGASQTSNEAQVTLGNLETTAATFKTLHDNFVKRYSEATEQQSFPYTEARLITKAVPPIGRSQRKTLLIVAAMPFLGLVLGIGLGILRDLMDQGFRTSTQIETILGLACVALVPLQKKPENKSTGQRLPSIGRPNPSLTSGRLEVASSVVEQPFSPFAEAMRTIKLAADLTGSNSKKVLGITSSVPDEGKSTVSAALAMSIAQVGGRVVLVDGDLRNPTLSRAIAPDAKAGILEVLSGEATLDDALNKEMYFNLAFLPVFSKARVANSSEILSSNAMKRLFERLRHNYDYVIVDLPPLAPLVDTRAAIHLVDSYLFVVDWGRTPTAIVQHALSRAPRVYEKTVGAILNKVNMEALSLYDGSYGGYYHDKAYGRYGNTG
jgi:succinoglycan biosynthesis transport protein ExoP